MNECYDRDPHPGVVDRIAAWLFPSLHPEPEADKPWSKPCVRGPCPGGCCVDHDHSGKRELEAGG